jgi:hypothetical protein
MDDQIADVSAARVPLQGASCRTCCVCPHFSSRFMPQAMWQTEMSWRLSPSTFPARAGNTRRTSRLAHPMKRFERVWSSSSIHSGRVRSRRRALSCGCARWAGNRSATGFRRISQMWLAVMQMVVPFKFGICTIHDHTRTFACGTTVTILIAVWLIAGQFLPLDRNFGTNVNRDSTVIQQLVPLKAKHGNQFTPWYSSRKRDATLIHLRIDCRNRWKRYRYQCLNEAEAADAYACMVLKVSCPSAVNSESRYRAVTRRSL